NRNLKSGIRAAPDARHQKRARPDQARHPFLGVTVNGRTRRASGTPKLTGNGRRAFREINLAPGRSYFWCRAPLKRTHATKPTRTVLRPCTKNTAWLDGSMVVSEAGQVREVLDN